MERPILFSTPMVRAILDGRKTMTRRVVKYPVIEGECGWHPVPTGFEYKLGGSERPNCPYGKAGDRLWVREKWFPTRFDFKELRMKEFIKYAADDNYDPVKDCVGRHWKPSIHMPRWASRINLEITDIRVERLQDITRGDAEAEGITEYLHQFTNDSFTELEADEWRNRTTIENFKHLWQSINGHESWNANPWVWVVEFKRV